MSTTEKDAQEQQRLRRQRVNRIKSAIVWTIALWMIFSLLAIIILSVQVVRLSHRVDKLESLGIYEETTESQKKQQADTEQLSSEPATEEFHIQTGIDTEDNMAGSEDVHYVYLTFDCIPGANTEEILNVLEEYQVKATFFVTEPDAEDADAVCRRIAEEGHTLGMSSYSNRYNEIYASEDAFYRDYEAISDYLYEVTGVRSKYYRFLGGSGNEVGNVDMADLVRMLNDKQITYFDWNVSAGDAGADYTAENVVANVIEGVSQDRTSVVLLHDDADKSETVEALGPLIEALQDAGCVVLPIDDSTNIIQYIKADSIE